MSYRPEIAWITVAVLAAAPIFAESKEKEPAKLSALEQYLIAARQAGAQSAAAKGSTWSSNSVLLNLAADLRARYLNDIVTIVVSERASAVSQGSVLSSRNSQAFAGVSALGGIPGASSALPNLLGLDSSRSLEGEGETSRRTTLTATMAARVSEVLPNGNLLIDGEKVVGIDSERQTIKLRGVIRPYDIDVSNAVSSNQIAQLELRINGKGVVGDAIKRPNFFYRLLLGLLPF